MSTSSHERYADLAGLYVLDALEPPERQEFETHAAECPTCAAETRELLPLRETLARAVPQVDPPEALRARVLSAIGVEPSNVRSIGERSATTRPVVSAWPSWLPMAATIALVAALGYYAIELRQRVGDLEARLSDATTRLAAAESQVVDAREVVFEAQKQMAVLAAPDLTRFDLRGQGDAPNAVGRGLWSRSQGLVFAATNLPELPTGRTYQLWFITGAGPINMGIVSPDDTGRLTTAIEVRQDLPAPTGMAVSLEGEAVVATPTPGQILLVPAAGL